MSVVPSVSAMPPRTVTARTVSTRRMMLPVLMVMHVPPRIVHKKLPERKEAPGRESGREGRETAVADLVLVQPKRRQTLE